MTLRKQPFILLELLIAFTLVSVAILPHLRFPHLSMKRELEYLFSMELEKVAQKRLVDIQQEIFEKKISPTLFFSDEKQKSPFYEKTVSVVLKENLKKKFSEYVFLKWEKQKRQSDETYITLASISVDYYPLGKKKKRILHAQTHVVVQKKK